MDKKLEDNSETFKENEQVIAEANKVIFNDDIDKRDAITKSHEAGNSAA